MKKLISILLALTLILSLSVSIFADEPTGTITITNATAGKEYKIYKIFDATISKDNEGNMESVAYTIKEGDTFFEYMFGATSHNTAYTYFEYNSVTGEVKKKASTANTELIAYLTQMVESGTFAEASHTETVNGSQVVFSNLSYGYYLITTGTGTEVTITSAAPTANVIDKNQQPATDFQKKIVVYTEGAEGTLVPSLENSNNAAIGDVIDYQITFTATNYDGSEQIRFYQIIDTIGDGLWANFESLQVVVQNGEETIPLTKGYYLNHGDAAINTQMTYLGTGWTAEDKAASDPASKAQWYLVHMGENQFRVTIPWLKNHELQSVTDDNDNVISHKLAFNSSESRFASNVTVKLT